MAVCQFRSSYRQSRSVYGSLQKVYRSLPKSRVSLQEVYSSLRKSIVSLRHSRTVYVSLVQPIVFRKSRADYDSL